MADNIAWEQMSPAQKKEELFRNQQHTLDLFLERNAISQEQYDKSLIVLRQKMGMEHIEDRY